MQLTSPDGSFLRGEGVQLGLNCPLLFINQMIPDLTTQVRDSAACLPGVGAGLRDLLPAGRPAGRRRAAAAGAAAPCGAARCSRGAAGGAAPRAPRPAPGALPWSSWLWP